MELGPAFLAILLLMTSGVSENLAERCEQPDPGEDCSYVSLLDAEPTKHQRSILQEMCIAGHVHSVKKKGQFVILNIHDDSSTDEVEWKSGKNKNFMCDFEWKVDKTVSLQTGWKGTGQGFYHWYLNGLPMWPILNQHLSHSRGRFVRLLFRSKLDWPNYAIATPAYMIENECNNRKEPNMSVGKLFRSDYVSKFSKSPKFKKFVHKFMKMFLDTNGKECGNPIKNLEDYSKWLQPLVNNSLLSMMESAKRLNRKRCPNELYVFFRNDPPPRFAVDLQRDLNSILSKAKCLQTTPVIGFLKGHYFD